MTYIQENRAKHILYPCPQPKGDENREAMPQTSLDQKSHASNWHPCKHCNSMVCDNLCPNYRRPSATSKNGDKSPPPPPYNDDVKSEGIGAEPDAI
jgi:hypothetical protein